MKIKSKYLLTKKYLCVMITEKIRENRKMEDCTNCEFAYFALRTLTGIKYVCLNEDSEFHKRYVREGNICELYKNFLTNKE